jgi:hypothetical protein
MDSLERLDRRLGGVRVAVTTEADRRADSGYDGNGSSLSKRLGCTGHYDLITSVTHVSMREVKRCIGLGSDTAERTELG